MKSKHMYLGFTFPFRRLAIPYHHSRSRWEQIHSISRLKGLELCLEFGGCEKSNKRLRQTFLWYFFVCFLLFTKRRQRVGKVKVESRKFRKTSIKLQVIYVYFSFSFLHIKVHQRTTSCFISLASKMTRWECERQSIRWLKRGE